MPVSSRKYPFIVFKPERPCGDVILEVEDLCKTIDGVEVLNNLSFTVNKGDKIAFAGADSLAKTTLFQILAGELEPDAGSFRWGQTITTSYFPKENSAFSTSDMNLVEWLSQFAPPNEGESYCPRFSRADALFRRRGPEEDQRALRRGKGALHAGADDADRGQRPDPRRAHQPSGPGIDHRPQQRPDRLPGGDALRLPRPRIRRHGRQPDHRDGPNGVIDKMVNFDDYLEDPEVARLREELSQGRVGRLVL